MFRLVAFIVMQMMAVAFLYAEEIQDFSSPNKLYSVRLHNNGGGAETDRLEVIDLKTGKSIYKIFEPNRCCQALHQFTFYGRGQVHHLPSLST